MKGLRVYLFFALLFLFAGGLLSSCARKSGCHAIEQTTKPNTKKNPKAQQHLFGKKIRRKRGRR